MKRNKTSKAWMHDHVNDPYVQRAQAAGYRSRAAFKLIEIDEKDRLLAPGMTVVDLGAAPGSWSQVVAKRIGRSGRLVGIDLLPVEPIPGAVFLQGDFASDEGLALLRGTLDERKVDLVLSDMAPNLSGVPATDQARMMHLAELTLEFAREFLNPGGDLLVKVFQGPDVDGLRRQLADLFEKVFVRKPKASRDRSAELYLLAKGLKRARIRAERTSDQAFAGRNDQS